MRACDDGDKKPEDMKSGRFPHGFNVSNHGGRINADAGAHATVRGRAARAGHATMSAKNGTASVIFARVVNGLPLLR